MGKLVFDDLRADVENFVENGSGHCPEPMAGHLCFGVVAEAPQCRVDGVVGHWPGGRSR